MHWASNRLRCLSALVLVSVLIGGCNFGSDGNVGTGGTTSGVWLQPDRTVAVAYRDMTAFYRDGAEWILAGQYQPTDLTINTSIKNTAGCGTNVCMYDSAYGNNGLNGWNSCNPGHEAGSDPNQTCSEQWVRINQTYSPPRGRIVCHEFGHSVGLRHTNEAASCMRRTADGGTSETLTTHDRDHLNGHYN